MGQPALRNRDGAERQRIPIKVQLVFGAVILAHVLALSVLGGAVLARYMLPVFPLVILICLSTLHRRLRYWLWWTVATCGAFLFALLVPPPYRVSPEDTLLYRDYIVLHKLAADDLTARHEHARVLTAWPASDELTRPFLGYVKQPLSVMRMENFSATKVAQAAHATNDYDILLLFSTKWQPPHPLLRSLPWREALEQRFFDYREDLEPLRAAGLVGGRIVRYWNRNNEWVAVIEIEKIEDAKQTVASYVDLIAKSRRPPRTE
jgi:hypothetical protein